MRHDLIFGSEAYGSGREGLLYKSYYLQKRSPNCSCVCTKLLLVSLMKLLISSLFSSAALWDIENFNKRHNLINTAKLR